jgi:hypothetical protein
LNLFYSFPARSALQSIPCGISRERERERRKGKNLAQQKRREDTHLSRDETGRREFNNIINQYHYDLVRALFFFLLIDVALRRYREIERETLIADRSLLLALSLIALIFVCFSSVGINKPVKRKSL